MRRPSWIVRCELVFGCKSRAGIARICSASMTAHAVFGFTEVSRIVGFRTDL